MTVLMTTTGRDAHPGRVTDSTDPQVPERARRRSFPAAFKLEVLAEYEAAGPGEKGAVLRRHGLYTSHLVSAYGLLCRSAYDLTCRSRRGDHGMGLGVGARDRRSLSR